MTTTSDPTGLRSSAVEDYAKAIYALQMRDDQPVSTTALAERLGVTPASASGMVKRLGELPGVTRGRRCQHEQPECESAGEHERHGGQPGLLRRSHRALAPL